VNKVLENFRLGKFHFILNLQEEVIFGNYPGFILRGAFGNILRRICCPRPATDCLVCPLRDSCPFAYLFFTSRPSTLQKPGKNPQVQKPYIFEVPFGAKSKYSEGERFAFDLILVGKSLDFFPYFLIALRELGSTGVGKTRGKYFLEEIQCLNELKNFKEMVYSGKDGVVRNNFSYISYSDLQEKVKGHSPLDEAVDMSVKVEFLTPTRLELNRSYPISPDFSLLIRRLFNRIFSLSFFHCGEILSLNFTEWIEQANKIRTVQAGTHWEGLWRYSRRQGIEMDFGGFMGTITYRGNIVPFFPFLMLGEYIHVGEKAAFGLGHYRLSLE